VPRLVEPALRRSLGLPARVLERFERGVGVLELDEEVDVVLGLRAAARPRRKAAAKEERDPAFLEDAGAGLHALEQLLERRFGHGPAVSVSLQSATSRA
jgi:hypothetical protein